MSTENVKTFIEELIQLQLKHKVLIEGYDISLWAEADSAVFRSKFNKSDTDIDPIKVRNYWEEIGSSYRPPVEQPPIENTFDTLNEIAHALEDDSVTDVVKTYKK